MEEMCKVLHLVYGVDCGGVEAVIYNYYTQMDRKKFHFDIVAQAKKGEDTSQHMFAKMLKELGSKIFYISPKSENLMGSMLQLNSVIRQGDYDIVHIHMGEGSTPYVLVAKLCGIKNIIVHTHIAHSTDGWSGKLSTKAMGLFLKAFKTKKMACSIDAAREIWAGQKVYILNNAVNVGRYCVNPKIREKKRAEFALEGCTAICTVARFDENKGHSLLLDIFAEYVILNKETRLVLIGTGSELEPVKAKAKKIGVYDKILFLGARKDVPEILQGMDVFVLPSQFEGFGIVYVEAQLAGLPTFAIDGAVPKAVKLCELLTYIPRESTPQEWAKKIDESIGKKVDEQYILKAARKKGLDIQIEAKKLEEYYLKLQGDK